MLTPAPWHVTGRGFILVYRFTQNFIRESCFLSEKFKTLKWSGLGYVMIVDYKDSPVGPYHELLIMPGKARFNQTRRNTISKIYVDSKESMLNGRNNWGIPKELTEFIWTENNGCHFIEIGSNPKWFKITVETGSIPFPIDTRLLSIHLHQELEKIIFKVSPICNGQGHFAWLKQIKVDPHYFPEISLQKPLLALYANPFKLTLSKPLYKYLNGD